MINELLLWNTKFQHKIKSFIQLISMQYDANDEYDEYA